jgi:hypothetical protein
MYQPKRIQLIWLPSWLLVDKHETISLENVCMILQIMISALIAQIAADCIEAMVGQTIVTITSQLCCTSQEGVAVRWVHGGYPALMANTVRMEYVWFAHRKNCAQNICFIFDFLWKITIGKCIGILCTGYYGNHVRPRVTWLRGLTVSKYPHSRDWPLWVESLVTVVVSMCRPCKMLYY